MLKPIHDWDDAFANMAYIPDSESLPQIWTDNAAAYRTSGVKIEQDIPYGDHPRERFDLIWPDETPKGLVIFVHGGYWMRLDKTYWSHLAEGARAKGWAICMPSYTLAPEARIHEITAQIGRAVTLAATHVEGPIRITGHSAGGHLATRMMCDGSPLSAATLARVISVLSISGVHDLRPLLHTKLNETLRLDDAESCSESPVLHRPARTVPYKSWVGGGERPEFIRQTQLIAQIWAGLDVKTQSTVDAQHNHFTVLDGLCLPESNITRALLE